MKLTILFLVGIGSVMGPFGFVIAEDEGVEEFGRRQFIYSCAVCHGSDADGNGIFGNSLLTKPNDLTVLAKNNGGEFPFAQVYDSIDGRNMTAAHGTKVMPVWGKHWQEKSPDRFTETYLRGRILEIIVYLRSVQKP